MYFIQNAGPLSNIRECTCRSMVPNQYLSIGGHTSFFGIPQSQIRKSWTHTAIANPQIAEVCQSANCKSQIRKIPWCPSPQTANPQICKQFWMRAFKLIFVRRTIIYLRICGSFKSAKILSSAKVASPQVADLRNLFADRPPLYRSNLTIMSTRPFFSVVTSITYPPCTCTPIHPHPGTEQVPPSPHPPIEQPTSSS